MTDVKRAKDREIKRLCGELARMEQAKDFETDKAQQFEKLLREAEVGSQPLCSGSVAFFS